MNTNRTFAGRFFQILAIVLGAVLLCVVVVNIAVVLYTGYPYVMDRITHKVHSLDNSVTVLSPDHKLAFIGEVNGDVRIRDESTKKTLASAKIDTMDYRNISVKWTEKDRIEVVAGLRYGYLMKANRMVWDPQLRVIEKQF